MAHEFDDQDNRDPEDFEDPDVDNPDNTNPDDGGSAGAIGEVAILRKPNPMADTTLPLTDEQLAAREVYRYSHNANMFGRQLSSRNTSNAVEFDIAQGMRYYTDQKMLVLLDDDEVEFEEIEDVNGKSLKGFGINKVNGVIQSLRGGQPWFGSKGSTRVKNLWDTELKAALEKARKKLNGNKLSRDQQFAATKEAQERFLAEIKSQGLERFVEYRRGWFLTPQRIRAQMQAPVNEFLQTPKPLLDDTYEEIKKLKRDKPDELVPYLYTGCKNDSELIHFIRTDPRPNDPNHQPPSPLVKTVDWFREPRYEIPRKAEDERGMTLRAHMAAQKEVLTAEDVYKWQKRTKERTHYYDHPEFKKLPAEVPRDDEAILAWAAQQVKDNPKKKKAAKKLAAFLRDYHESWLTVAYDRWLPNECYSFRNEFFDSVAYYDPSDYSTVADRIKDFLGLQIYVDVPPEVVGVYPDVVADFRGFRDYVATVQVQRWMVELWDHWKMIKSTHNSRAAEDLENSDIKNARRNSLGGPEKEEKRAYNDWRYNKLSEAAGDDPERRLELLGPLWSKKQPHQPIDHAGALATKFKRKSNSLLDGLGKVRNLASMAGGRAFPEIDQLREKFTTQVRSYPTEYQWMLNDEYTTMDPVDAWKHQSGILTFSLLDEANLRLDGSFAHVPGLRLAYSTSDTGRAFTNLSGFIEEMWNNLPPTPIVDKVEEKIAAWKHHNVEHLRHDLDLLLKGVKRSKGRHGLDKYFTGFYQRRNQLDRALDKKVLGKNDKLPFRDLQIINRMPILDSQGREARKEFEKEWEWVPGWYEQSDNRIHERLFWWLEAGSSPGKGGASGAGGFTVKDASDLNKASYGLGYGTLGEQQERQERLYWIGLWAGYFSTIKHFLQWFDTSRKSVELLPDFDEDGVTPNKSWLTLNHVKLKVADLVKSGSLLHFIARDELWPRLKKMDPALINEPYPFGDEVAEKVDDEFVTDILDFMVGTDSRPGRKSIILGDADKRAIEPIILENFELYSKVTEGRFFETNHHHTVFVS